MKEIKTIKEFEDILENENVIIKVGTSTCGMCNVVEGFLNQLEPEYGDISFCKVDAEECDQNLLDGELSIVESIPSVIFIKNKKLQHVYTGIQPVAVIKKNIEETF